MYSWDERFVFSQERNSRTTLWNSQRESWIQVHTDVWQGADGDESGAYLCVYESEKTSKDQK